MKSATQRWNAHQDEVNALKAQLIEIRQAIQDPGPAPLHHEAVMAKHRREWPTLWRALDKVLNT